MSAVKIWLTEDECYDVDVIMSFRKLIKPFKRTGSKQVLTYVMILKAGYAAHPDRSRESIFLDDEQADRVRAAMMRIQRTEESSR